MISGVLAGQTIDRPRRLLGLSVRRTEFDVILTSVRNREEHWQSQWHPNAPLPFFRDFP